MHATLQPQAQLITLLRGHEYCWNAAAHVKLCHWCTASSEPVVKGIVQIWVVLGGVMQVATSQQGQSAGEVDAAALSQALQPLQAALTGMQQSQAALQSALAQRADAGALLHLPCSQRSPTREHEQRA
jgi:hypothetical protein